MAVLSDTSIIKLHESGVEFITPFRYDSLQPATYDMHLYWKILVSPTRYEKGHAVNLREEANNSYAIDTGRLVGILTEEVFDMPLNLSARFGLRSEFTRQGLVAFGGIQIDPGFKGRLAMSLFHTGPEPINLVSGQSLFTVEFHRLEEPASTGYGSKYQDQYDFHPEQEKFIIEANTSSLSEIGSLPRGMQELSLRLARHETTHRGVAPLSVADLAELQGVEPITDLKILAGAWPDDESIKDFLASVRKWRGR